MDVKIKAIHFDATEKLQAYIEKKVAKIAKACDEVQTIEVQLKVVKPATAMNKEVAITVAVPGDKLYVDKTADTFEEGVDAGVDSLRVQIEKYKEKLRDH